MGSDSGPAAGGGPAMGRFCWFAGILLVAYGWILWDWARYAMAEGLHSHVVLIPFVSWYLIHLDRARWPAAGPGSQLGALLLAVPGTALLVFALLHRTGGGAAHGALSHNDFLAAAVGSFLCFLWAGGFLFLGRKWMAAAAFPAAFLLFMIPLPDAAVNAIEHTLVAATSEVVDFFFLLTGVPFLRNGNVFQISTLTLQVAQECSGIRSSWVLFITSLLASYLFLRNPWHRALIVALVIPLGILRNGFRILVLAQLCIHRGPHMIDSDLHHQGGPIFFALSLIPLFLLLWWFRRMEAQGERVES
ncbi:MAG: exosortase/archaeosortase family protein [Verrucomicrobiota bacterium]